MKNPFYFIPSLFLVCLLVSTNTSAQDGTTPFFKIEGEVLTPLKLTVEDLIKLNQTEVKTKDRDGREHTYQGVRLVDLLDSAGVTFGKDLRGENLAKYIMIKAADGYEVIFSLPEIDPEFTSQTIILAYTMDGRTLPKGDGPFRIVAPGDKKQARWIRELVAIKVVFSKE